MIICYPYQIECSGRSRENETTGDHISLHNADGYLKRVTFSVVLR